MPFLPQDMFIGFADPNAKFTVNRKWAKEGKDDAKHPFFIVTEEGIGNVVIYPVNLPEGAARNAFNSLSSSRILYNRKGDELDKGGMGLARNTVANQFTEWLSRNFDD